MPRKLVERNDGKRVLMHVAFVLDTSRSMERRNVESARFSKLGLDLDLNLELELNLNLAYAASRQLPASRWRRPAALPHGVSVRSSSMS